MFKLHYHVQNCGDGSVNVCLHNSKKDAEAADEGQYDRWGESSAGTVQLAIQDGKIVRKTVEVNDGKVETIWVPLEETKD